MRDHLRSHIYVVEDAAWEDTLLAEHPGYETLVQDCALLMESAYWITAGGPIYVVFERILPNKGVTGLGSAWRVQLTNTAARYVAAHEMAHVLAHNAHDDVRGHGTEWRGFYVGAIRALYGREYSERLRSAFLNGGFPIEHPEARQLTRPLVDLDRLGGEVRGGWQR